MQTPLQRIANGDADAVPAVVDAHGGLVWRIARRRLGPGSPELEDVVQEVFTELWRHASRYDPSRGSESAFVATIALRRAADAQRRQVSQARLADAARERAREGAPARGSLDSDAERAVLRAFDQLSDDERDAIWLRIHGGMTHEQIGASLGQKPTTIRTWVFRGLRRLRASIIEAKPAPARDAVRIGDDSHG